MAEVATCILNKEFPFTYLGCPIFYKRKQISYYQHMIQRIRFKIRSWKGKLLSFGGRAILIKNSWSISYKPSNQCLKSSQKMMVQFFWSSCIGGRERHWTKWSNLCLTEKERGLDSDLCEIYQWHFFVSYGGTSELNHRYGLSIWEISIARIFMSIQLCGKLEKGVHKYGKKILQARDLIECQILWHTRNGSTSVWHEKCTGLGDLYDVTAEDFSWDDTNKQLMN